MKLQKFIKNKKQKQILIGAIIGIIVLIGGITLYRTFALYKEEKTFDILQGQVPDFSGIYKEKLLNGAYPVLDEEGKLIPVIIGNNGKVTKASLNSKWYKYGDKQWANAVILKEGVETPEDNAEIDESNIESYFVWIPKYRYKIFDLGDTYTGLATVQSGKAQQIEIEFGLTDTQDEKENECVAPESGSNGECKKDYWMTHPAFTTFGTNGFWVGKFESSNAGNKVQIKPNVVSWKSINIKTMFDTSYNYQRNLDSHMLKNTEWGAVAYLSHSKYGTCNNNQCTEVRLNNNSGYVTGYAAKTEPTTGYNAYNSYENKTPTQDGNSTINYTNSLSQVASTTGNYTGVYDMSGGAWEYVMGVMKNANNNGLSLSSSGFTLNDIPFKTDEEIDYSKYYDAYEYSSVYTTYNKRILGDATGELGPFEQKRYNNSTRIISSWYDDESYYLYRPWAVRGGVFSYGIGSGIFAFDQNEGVGLELVTFRVALAPTN